MSGRLKHKLRFFRQSDSTDSFGNVVSGSDVKVMDVKANVQVISGSERINQGTALDSEFISCMVRYDTRIKHDLILQWQGNKYTIDNIRPDDKNMKMIVQASREIRSA